MSIGTVSRPASARRSSQPFSPQVRAEEVAKPWRRATGVDGFIPVRYVIWVQTRTQKVLSGDTPDPRFGVAHEAPPHSALLRRPPDSGRDVARSSPVVGRARTARGPVDGRRPLRADRRAPDGRGPAGRVQR